MMNSPCPNCGQLILPHPGEGRISCPSCNEGLVWSEDGRKLLLENPLPTYLDTANEEAQFTAMWNQADHSEQLIDIHRRQASVELATRWVRDRIALGNRTLEIGGVIIILCGVLCVLAFGLYLLRASIQLDTFVLFIFSSLLAPFGVFFVSWSLVERASIAKYTKRIQEDRQMLQERERYLLH